MATLLRVPSRSPLLHASLAHLTPECIAVDRLIQCPGRHPRLPTELMLIVRTHLVSDLSASLAEESRDALAAYSQSLISLLCADCTSYNTEIYGADVFDWPWDQFSGPCLCTGDVDDCIARTKAFTDSIAELQCDPARTPQLFRRLELGASPCNPQLGEGDSTHLKGGLLQFSPELLDPQFFLELHLSRQARRFARLAYKEELKSIGRGGFTESRTGLLKIRNIWDAVEMVLGEQYGCEVIPKQGGFVSTHTANTDPSPPVAASRAVKPTSKPKIHSQPPIEACSNPQIVQLDLGDLEALRALNPPIPTAPFFPSGLMSTPRCRDQDPIYISLVVSKQRDTSGVRDPAEPLVVDDPWKTVTLLHRARHSLGLSSPTLTCSCLSAPVPPSNCSHSCGTGDPRHSVPLPLRSRNPNSLDIPGDSTPNYRAQHPSVPSPATKTPPVSPPEPTTGITGPAVTAGITEGLLDVDADVRSNLGQGAHVHLANQGLLETAVAGVRCDRSRERRPYGRAVVVGAPGAEATRQSLISGSASVATNSSASSPPLPSELLLGDNGTGNHYFKFLAASIPGVYACPGPARVKNNLLSALALVQSVATACLCAPLAIVSVAATIVCFYTHPRSIRAF